MRGHEFLLEAATPLKVSIRDVVLGERSGDAEQLKVIEGFFRQVGEGNLDQSRLVGRWSEYLKAWALSYKDGFDLLSVRIGLAHEEMPGTWNVPVRIFTKTAEYQGWIVLVRYSNELLVSDVQIEAADSPKPFDPESQAQEISSPIRR